MKKKSCPIDTSTQMSMMDFQNQSQFIENPNFSSSAWSSSNWVDEISNRSITGVRLSPIIKKENRMLSKVLDSFDSGQSMRDEKYGADFIFAFVLWLTDTLFFFSNKIFRK